LLSTLAELRECISERNVLTLKLGRLRNRLLEEGLLPKEYLIELEEQLSNDNVMGQEVLRHLDKWLVVGPPVAPAPILSALVRPNHSVPPAAACLLLDLLLAKADRNVIPGDLAEEFTARLTKYGPNGARLWFWAESMRTIAMRNPVCRSILVGGLMRLGEWIFRQIGS
jgi:hypothetical protein